MKNLRDVLVVPAAARGLSIFGLDSFKLLVEESTEEYALGVLNSLKIKQRTRANHSTLCHAAVPKLRMWLN